MVSLKSKTNENDFLRSIHTHHVILLVSRHRLLVKLDVSLRQIVFHLLSLLRRVVLRGLLLRHLFVSDSEGERIGISCRTSRLKSLHCLNKINIKY